MLVKKLRNLKIISKNTKVMKMYEYDAAISRNFKAIDRLVKSKIDFGILAGTGLPAFIDPGYEIIDYCQKKYFDQIEFVPLGLSSIIDAALCLSGKNMQNFIFLGIFPNMKLFIEQYLVAPAPYIVFMTGDNVNYFFTYIYQKVNHINRYVILKDIRKTKRQRMYIEQNVDANTKKKKYKFNKEDDITIIIF